MADGTLDGSTADVEVTLGEGVRVAVLRCGMSAAFAARAAGGESVAWPLLLVLGAPLLVRQEEGGTLLYSGDLVLWDPARPVDVSTAAGDSTCVTVLRLPPRALPITGELLGRLAGRPVASVSGPAALLARFLEGVADVASSLVAARSERLGSAAIDLAIAFLASLPAARPSAPQPSGREALLARLTSYIIHHLDDPELGPRKVARAHHMSVRSLQYLFQRNDRTVSRYILDQRLRRCRADLSDPSLSGLAVGRIASRWGFSSDAVFCRTFKHAYGLPPGEWRKRHLRLP
jgi:AraC-like DNA-binding protein